MLFAQRQHCFRDQCGCGCHDDFYELVDVFQFLGYHGGQRETEIPDQREWAFQSPKFSGWRRPGCIGGSVALWPVWDSVAEAIYAFAGWGLRFGHRGVDDLGLRRVVFLKIEYNLKFGCS
jgi:hypothetical protein